MKALVLAGGSGSRLRPITHTSAKQLLPVANKPVLFYGLEAIARRRHHRRGDRGRGYRAGDRGGGGRWQRVRPGLTYIPQDAPLGLAHAVLIARDFLADDDFVMYLGDNFIVGGIRSAGGRVPAGPARCADHADPGARSARSSVSRNWTTRAEVVGLEEKPSQPKSDLALVGVYIFTPAVHEAVAAARAVLAGRAGDHRGHSVADRLRPQVRSTLITGYWKDTGNVADMLEVNRMVLETVEPRRAARSTPGASSSAGS